MSSLTRPPRHIESPPSIVHLGTRPPPCHVPRACQHILGPAVVCPRWASPQLKQAAAASRSLSRPELTRKAEALNQAVDPYLPAPIRSEGLPPSEASLAPLSGPPIRDPRFRSRELSVFTTANHCPSHTAFARPHNVALAHFPPTGNQFIPNLGPIFLGRPVSKISWPPACASFHPERLPCRLKRTRSVGPCPSGFPPNIAPALHFKE